MAELPKHLEDSCLPLVQNLLLLDADGKRVAVKYFGETWTSNAAQAAFEKAVFAKTSRVNARGERASTGAGAERPFP